jgi:hypothetical protein
LADCLQVFTSRSAFCEAGRKTQRTFRNLKLIGFAAALAGGVVLIVNKAGVIGTGSIAAEATGGKNLGDFSICSAPSWAVLRALNIKEQSISS